MACRGDTFPFPFQVQDRKHNSFVSMMEELVMERIDLYCKNCKSSMHVSYRLSGQSGKLLLDGAIMKCFRCKRVIMIKGLTEGRLMAGADSYGKYYR